MKRRDVLRGMVGLGLGAAGVACGSGRAAPAVDGQRLTANEYEHGPNPDEFFTLRIETPGPAIHRRAEPIPIKFLVTNRWNNRWSFDTRDQPLRERLEPPVEEGLDPPRPAYDLLFSGSILPAGATGPQQRYVWVWSAHERIPPPTTISLGARETLRLIDMVWQPPPGAFIQGGFRVRFAAVEGTAGISISPRLK